MNIDKILDDSWRPSCKTGDSKLGVYPGRFTADQQYVNCHTLGQRLESAFLPPSARKESSPKMTFRYDYEKQAESENKTHVENYWKLDNNPQNTSDGGSFSDVSSCSGSSNGSSSFQPDNRNFQHDVTFSAFRPASEIVRTTPKFPESPLGKHREIPEDMDGVERLKMPRFGVYGPRLLDNFLELPLTSGFPGLCELKITPNTKSKRIN